MPCNRIYPTELQLNEIKQEYEYLYSLGLNQHLIKNSYFYYIYYEATQDNEGNKHLEELSWLNEKEILKKYTEYKN